MIDRIAAPVYNWININETRQLFEPVSAFYRVPTHRECVKL